MVIERGWRRKRAIALEQGVFTNIETARLRLRRFAEADLPAFIAYRNDPDVARYQSWEGISEAEAVAFVREHYHRRAVETPWQRRYVARWRLDR